MAADEPATLVWVEAMDGGNPKEKVPHRDRILMAKAPFKVEPMELFEDRTALPGHAVRPRMDSLALVNDYERNKRWRRTFVLDPDKPGRKPKLLVEPQYSGPLSQIRARRVMTHGARTGQPRDPSQNGDYHLPDAAWARARRATIRFSTASISQPANRIGCSTPSRAAMRCSMTLLDDDGTKILTLRESPTEPPNYYIRTTRHAGELKPFTNFPIPRPAAQDHEAAGHLQAR